MRIDGVGDEDVCEGAAKQIATQMRGVGRLRTVPTGLAGLDTVLGGGVRLVRRTQLEDRESATVLVQGGVGTGKSVLGQELGLGLAQALAGDVVYVCVEILPSEVIAQRTGFAGFDDARVVDLSREARGAPADGRARLVVGLRDAVTGSDGVPDIGQAVLDLARIASERGCAPKVIVVDALGDGYGLGRCVPRVSADGLCKLAAEQGWGLILLEEVTHDGASPWAFAVDTVVSLELQGDMETRRLLRVIKHRFGPSAPGPHTFEIESSGVRVICGPGLEG